MAGSSSTSLRRSVGGRTGPARRPRARSRADQFVEVEGLAEVVVGAEVEPGDAVAQPARGGEHQDARGGVRGGQPPADLVAVHPREVAVEDDDVVVVQDGLVVAAQAVQRHVDGHAAQPQSTGHGAGESLFVFDDEYAHLVAIIAARV